jgi:hypothetical protein
MKTQRTAETHLCYVDVTHRSDAIPPHAIATEAIVRVWFDDFDRAKAYRAICARRTGEKPTSPISCVVSNPEE